MESLWSSCNSNAKSFRRVHSLESSSDMRKSYDEEETHDPEALTEDDWTVLLQGSKKVTFVKDQVIVTEGENFQRIYQISTGSCRIEKSGKPLGEMGEGATFGEVSFLLSGGASASVIADSSSVEVYLLEGYYINILFGMKPELAGRFYKYLAKTLQRTVQLREAERK